MEFLNHSIKKCSGIVAAIVTLFLSVGCTHHTNSQFEFSGTIEGLNAGDTKLHLVDERWLYWDLGDLINIASDLSDMQTAYLTTTHQSEEFRDDYNALFVTELDEESKYFLALFPASSSNGIVYTSDRNFAATMSLPAEQLVTSDITFSRSIFPMVAWYGGDGVHRLNFRALAGIARVQLFTTAETKTLRSITFEEVSDSPKQISGQFNLDSSRTTNPHLVSIANTADNRKITMTFTDTNNTLYSGGEANMMTFYLVLPAVGGEQVTTTYTLRMTITTTDDIETHAVATIPIRRRGLTYLNAIQISDWSGELHRGLVGNGTEERPFKIYTLDDLIILRDAFALDTLHPVINNIPITADTRFQIMRTDITLDARWTSGIRNFTGHMTYNPSAASANQGRGITNNTRQPLFASIGGDGDVDGVIMHAFTSFESASSFSPFCGVNRGKISRCQIMTNNSDIIEYTPNGTDGGLGGLCVYNHGTITASGCLAWMSSPQGYVGGISLFNYGTIEQCYIATPARITSAEAVGGICYSNEGQITDCYATLHITSSTLPWGGIAYKNQGSVKHCYTGINGQIYTTSSVGGIVNTNTGSGLVDYCWCESQLRGSIVGGIVASMNGGTVVNCYTDNEDVYHELTRTGSAIGGLVGSISGGTVSNSYCYLFSLSRTGNTGYLGGFVGNMTGGNISNCYVYELLSDNRLFYGHKTAGTLDRCYTVDASTAQTDVNADLSPVYATDATLASLLDKLNTAPLPSGAVGWQRRNNAGLPILNAYQP